MTEEVYRELHSSQLIAEDIRVNFIDLLLRQDMDNQIWKTTNPELSVKPDYNKKWLTEKLALDEDEITVTISSNKRKLIEYTKKLKIKSPSDDDLLEWDRTHDKKFVSRMRDPPHNQIGGNGALF